MTFTVRIPTGTISYQVAPFVGRPPPEREYVDVRIELTPEEVAEIRRQRATISVGYTITSEFDRQRRQAEIDLARFDQKYGTQPNLGDGTETG